MSSHFIAAYCRPGWPDRAPSPETVVGHLSAADIRRVAADHLDGDTCTYDDLLEWAWNHAQDRIVVEGDRHVIDEDTIWRDRITAIAAEAIENLREYTTYSELPQIFEDDGCTVSIFDPSGGWLYVHCNAHADYPSEVYRHMRLLLTLGVLTPAEFRPAGAQDATQLLWRDLALRAVAAAVDGLLAVDADTIQQLVTARDALLKRESRCRQSGQPTAPLSDTNVILTAAESAGRIK